MAQKIYVVEGRKFRTEADYQNALKDQQVIENLRVQTKKMSLADQKKLLEVIRSGRCRFHSILGQDYMEELSEDIQRQEGKVPETSPAKGHFLQKENTKTIGKAQTPKNKKEASKKKETVKKESPDKKVPKKRPTTKKKTSVKKKAEPQFDESEIDKIVQEELKKQEKRRKLLVVCCSVIAVACLGYFGIYNWYNIRTADNYEQLSELKDKEPATGQNQDPVIHYTADETQSTPPPVLDEYKNLLNKNKRLIGWVKIDDTNIDYPVMQTTDNEYYLDHNLNQEYDKNGSIFMDKDCDVLKPSTNFILYGHHMKSGQMFGSLSSYSDQSYCEKHPYIQFDTIYEKGLYEIMYVFRSRVYSEDEIVFKYYQFIDAQSEQEFDSYMNDMAEMSLYDTGVTASFGDQLLTLSTCDYQEKNGRFVVVAKKVTTKE